MIINRRNTRRVLVGNTYIGSGDEITIQSMTNTDTRDIKKTVKQIEQLAFAGCQIIRIAIPDMEAANAVAGIVKIVNIPVIADIHFDYKLALKSIKNGIHGVRINPGNIGSLDNVKAVAQLAGEYNIPIRIGANSGSLAPHLQQKIRSASNVSKESILTECLVESALEQCNLLEKFEFKDIKVSLKSSDTLVTIEAYRKFAKLTDYPLHLGVTEAGTRYHSMIKSSVGIGTLLSEGIGDTIRVSITGDPVDEISVARSILESLSIRKACPEIISCPTCGRTETDLVKVSELIEKKIADMKGEGIEFIPSKIAIMGCAVNGPGEAKDADLGIAGAKNGKFVVFAKGEQVGFCDEENAVEKFTEMMKNKIII